MNSKNKREAGHWANEETKTEAEVDALINRVQQLERELEISYSVNDAHREWAHRVTRKLHDLNASLDREEVELAALEALEAEDVPA
jgi:hypothetical protein